MNNFYIFYRVTVLSTDMFEFALNSFMNLNFTFQDFIVHFVMNILVHYVLCKGQWKSKNSPNHGNTDAGGSSEDKWHTEKMGFGVQDSGNLRKKKPSFKNLEHTRKNRQPSENDDSAVVETVSSSINEVYFGKENTRLSLIIPPLLSCAKGEKDDKVSSGKLTETESKCNTSCGISGRSGVLNGSCSGVGGGNGSGGGSGDDDDEEKEKRKPNYVSMTDDEYQEDEEEKEEDTKTVNGLLEEKSSNYMNEQLSDDKRKLSIEEGFLDQSEDDVNHEEKENVNQQEVKLPSVCSDESPGNCSYFEINSCKGHITHLACHDPDERNATAACKEEDKDSHSIGFDPKDNALAKLNRKFTSAFHCLQYHLGPAWACTHEHCKYISQLLKHGMSCEYKILLNGCNECVNIIKLHLFHGHHCTDRHCPVPTCPGIKSGIPPAIQHGDPSISSGLLLAEWMCFQERILDLLPIVSTHTVDDESNGKSCEDDFQTPIHSDITCSSVPRLCDKILSPLSMIYLSHVNGHYKECRDYKILHFLGGGQFGRCFLSRDEKTRKLFVLKKIQISNFDEEEVIIHKLLSNITLDVVEFYGALQKQDYVMMFMEFMDGGSVREVLSTYGTFEEPQALYVAYQILKALEWIHSYLIIHRDVKGGNIVLDSTGLDVKLCDFGCSLRLNPGQKQTEPGLTPVGTENFMDPRVSRSEAYCYTVDSWSLACTIIQMLTGKPPWADHRGVILYQVATNPHPEIPTCSPRVQEFLEACFSDADSRPTAKELMNFSAFNVLLEALPLQDFACQRYEGVEESTLNDSEQRTAYEEDKSDGDSCDAVEQPYISVENDPLRAPQVSSRLDEELQSLQEDLSFQMLISMTDPNSLDVDSEFGTPCQDGDPFEGQFTYNEGSVSVLVEKVYTKFSAILTTERN